MHTEQHALEQQVSELREQLSLLNQRVEQLEQAPASTVAATRLSVASPEAKEEKPSTESSLLIDSSSLLKLVSVLCFLLVAALGLRALADNGLLSLQLGTIIGICYAAALIIVSHLFYRKNNTLAPLFAITGALLMFSILVETYSRFAAIPMVIVYSMLAATGIGMALISYANKAALPIIIGTLGMCLAGVAIDFPTPFFPFLGLLLWTSNILGFFATRLKRCSWLRWLLLFTTHFMLQIWGLKLGGNHLLTGDQTGTLSPDWFIPIVTLIGFTFMLISLFGIIRSGEEKISKFDFSLPAVNAGWCYVAGIYAMKNPVAFGAPAAAAAIIHFGIAYWLSTREKRNAPGTNTFVAGGVILTCLSLPAILGSMLTPLPLLAALAFGIVHFSRQWSSGGMRTTANLLQVYVCLVLAIDLFNRGLPKNPPAILLATALCGLFALIHYRFCRRHQPPEHSLFFQRFDKHDMSTVFVLLSGLVNGYFLTTTIAHIALFDHYQGDIHSAFIATQSVIINGFAILFMILAIRYQNKELRNISILITLVGGGKVFIIDMLQISGTWLVASIFVFGIAAALESLVLARWQTKTEDSEEHAKGFAANIDPDEENQQTI